MNKSIFQKSWIIMMLGVIGITIGIVIIMFRYRVTFESEEFVNSPEFLMWFFLIVLQTALFVILPFPLIKALKQLKPFFIGKKLEIAMFSFIFVILFWGPYFLPKIIKASTISFPLAYHSIKIQILVLLGFITTVLPSLIGISLIHSELLTTYDNLKPNKKSISQYLLFQKHLNMFVSILGIMVGLLTLATGALRNTAISVGADPKNFPVLLVLCYGSYYTILIALIYIPAYNTLLNTGRQICNLFFPIESPDSTLWSDTYTKRKNLEEFLQLQISMQQRFRTGISIIAPLLSGIVSLLLN